MLTFLLLFLAVNVDALQTHPITSKRFAAATRVSLKASLRSTDVQSLLKSNRALLDSMATLAPETPELVRLRFALAFSDPAEAKAALKDAVFWRKGAGRAIVDSAADAVAKATAGGGWDNELVRAAAPHADVINPFITAKNILTMSTAEGDFVYVIRASSIDDRALMAKASVDQVIEYLLYVKEVHNLVLNARSERTGRLCSVIFANDITGIRKPPEPLFSKALTGSSKSYERLYPSLAGPTMILNLPFILQAFVGFFKPLFPKSVQARLKFGQAPLLSKLNDLTPLTADAQKRSAFLDEVAGLLR